MTNQTTYRILNIKISLPTDFCGDLNKKTCGGYYFTNSLRS